LLARAAERFVKGESDNEMVWTTFALHGKPRPSQENTPAGRLAKIWRAGQFKRSLEMGN
jgi:hypothetical protein